jgi:flavodoxin
MSKILTVYYSRKGENHFPDGIRSVPKGNTAFAAEHIQATVGGDLFEIDTVKPYAENYRACCGEAVVEMKSNARPEIKGYVEDMSQYDTIFVGYPCWCGTAPMCVFTFLEHYDFTGKTIIPFCTNEGSGLANSVTHIRQSCPGANVVEGQSFRGHKCEAGAEEIGAWAKEQI